MSRFGIEYKKNNKRGGVSKMKKILGLLLILAVMTGIGYAATNPDNIVLTVTIGNIAYGVSISSASNYFGTVNLGASSNFYIGTLSNDGNTMEDWQVQGTNASGPNSGTWSLVSTIPVGNEYALMLGTSVAGASMPNWTDGVTASSVTTSQAAANAWGQKADVGYTRGLWSRITMPTTSSQSGVFSFTVSIWGTAP